VDHLLEGWYLTSRAIVEGFIDGQSTAKQLIGQLVDTISVLSFIKETKNACLCRLCLLANLLLDKSLEPFLHLFLDLFPMLPHGLNEQS
jgi:hypothetical protein